MIAQYPHSISCGITLLGGETHYQTAKAWMDDLARQDFVYNPVQKAVLNKNRANYKCFIFTHNKDINPIGTKIAEYIKEHGLGDVVESVPAGNPVHNDHPITVWVWSRNKEAYYKYAEALLTPKEVKDGNPRDK
jgi:hypothetical protein